MRIHQIRITQKIVFSIQIWNNIKADILITHRKVKEIRKIKTYKVHTVPWRMLIMSDVTRGGSSSIFFLWFSWSRITILFLSHFKIGDCCMNEPLEEHGRSIRKMMQKHKVKLDRKSFLLALDKWDICVPMRTITSIWKMYDISDTDKWAIVFNYL